MPTLSTSEYPEKIRLLLIELERVEVQLGLPGTPPEVEARVIVLAHRLRNEIQLHALARHPAVREGRQEAALATR
ncbi:MAG: hypothetical protein H7067_17170 [Burkholderiales bacterium]|nr:hypothetical protein [Opitutaceae bacterium]